ASQAVVDKRFSGQLAQMEFSGDATVSLSNYHPERLSYDFSSNSEQFIVFSDMYYAPGWNAYVDGKSAEHIRVNYLLRGMVVPAGDHTIEYRYEPASVVVGNKVVVISSLLLFLAISWMLYQDYKKKKVAS
ncbi:MAG: YfhO family protein, partial [Cyclobacteriaceae bacterium]|nr:YfhO family protein [Cyclobacteriaceae bacterium]